MCNYFIDKTELTKSTLGFTQYSEQVLLEIGLEINTLMWDILFAKESEVKELVEELNKWRAEYIFVQKMGDPEIKTVHPRIFLELKGKKENNPYYLTKEENKNEIKKGLTGQDFSSYFKYFKTARRPFWH